MKNPAPNTEGFWEPSPWFLAQSAHLGWAIAFYVPALVCGWDAWIFFGIVFAGTFFKEFFVDISPFERDSWSGSAQDFWFWQMGSIGARILISSPFWGMTWVLVWIGVAFGIDLYENAHWSVTPYD